MTTSENEGANDLNEVERRLQADAEAFRRETAYLDGGACWRCSVTVGDSQNPGCPHGGHERAGDSPINVKLLDRTLEAIENSRKLLVTAEGHPVVVPAEPNAPDAPIWSQGSWRAFIMPEDVAEGQEQLERCGTALCLAGWADQLDGLPGEMIWLLNDQELASEALSILDYGIYLHRRDDDDELTGVERRGQTVVTASDRAYRLLGLTRTMRLLDDLPVGLYRDTIARDGLDAIDELFSASNSLETLFGYAACLRRLNNWLIDHHPAFAHVRARHARARTSDEVTGPADAREETTTTDPEES